LELPAGVANLRMRLRCPHAHLCALRMKLPRMKLPSMKLPRMCVPSMTCPPFDDLEYRVCSSVQAPVLTGPHRCVRRGPPRGQPHAWAARLYLRSLATGVLGATSVECSTLSGPRICERIPPTPWRYGATATQMLQTVFASAASPFRLGPHPEGRQPTLSLQQLCIHCIPLYFPSLTV
jgi:hypothetical protein